MEPKPKGQRLEGSLSLQPMRACGPQVAALHEQNPVRAHTSHAGRDLSDVLVGDASPGGHHGHSPSRDSQADTALDPRLDATETKR